MSCNRHVAKLPSKYVFSYKSLMLGQRSCFCGGQRDPTIQSAELSDCWVFSPKWDIYINTFKAQGIFWKGKQKKM